MDSLATNVMSVLQSTLEDCVDLLRFLTRNKEMRTENMTRMTPDHKYTCRRCLYGFDWYGVTRVSIRKADASRPSIYND